MHNYEKKVKIISHLPVCCYACDTKKREQAKERKNERQKERKKEEEIKQKKVEQEKTISFVRLD